MQFLKILFRRQSAVALIILAFIAVLILALIVGTHPVPGFDLSISQKIQSSGTEYLPFMRLVSYFGSGFMMIALPLLFSALFLIFNKRREAGFILGVFVADILNILIKQAVHRARPTADVIAIYQKFTDSSFPSAHVVHYVVFFGFLAVSILGVHEIPLIIRVIISSASVILIALVSVSRIYLGAHWATDVIGGYLVGFLLLITLFLLYFEPKFKDP